MASCYQESIAKDYIEQRDGNYYVAGTRVFLDSLVHAFRRGESPETIWQNFVAYYLANQADIAAYLLRQGQKWAEGKRSSEPLPASLRERLTRARDGMFRPSQPVSTLNLCQWDSVATLRQGRVQFGASLSVD